MKKKSTLIILTIKSILILAVLQFSGYNLNFKLYSQNTKSPLAAYEIAEEWKIINENNEVIFSRNDITEVFGFGEGILIAKVKENVDGINKEKWTAIDLNGKDLFKVDYDEMGVFHDGFAIVTNYINKETGDKIFGFVDKKGKLVVPMEYMDAIPFSEGYAYVMKDGKRGYLSTKMDNSGSLEMAITLNGKVGYNFSEGLASISNEEYIVGFIDKKGKVVIDYRFDEPAEFSEGKAKITLGGKFGFIDTSGNIIINVAYDEAKPYKNNRTFLAQNTAGVPKWALADEFGNRLTEYVFDSCEMFSQNYGLVRFEGSLGFVNNNGEFAFPDFYNYLLPFNDLGLAFVSNEEYGNIGFIDTKGAYKVKLPRFNKGMDLVQNRKIEVK